MHFVAIFTAILSGVTYWLIWGNGMEQVDYMLGRKRDAKRKAVAIDEAGRAPLKAVEEPRDAATILMVLVATRRGEMTGEQEALILEEMRTTLEYEEDLPGHLSVARHATSNAPSPQVVVTVLRDVLRRHLSRTEFNQLSMMLRKVAALHGGPTEEQEKLISYAERTLPPTR